MNDYDIREQSEEDGVPFYAYRFTRGDTSWFLTSYNETVNYTGSEEPTTGISLLGDAFFDKAAFAERSMFSASFRPANIELTSVKTVKAIAAAEITLTLPRDDPFSDEFMNSFTKPSTELTIYRGHSTKSKELRINWRGRIVGSKAQKDTMELVAENVTTQLLRLGLRAKYQKTCRHVLYGKGCGLNIANWQTNATITAINALTLTVPQAVSFPPNYFQGGIMTVGESNGFIVSHIGDALKLNSPVQGLEVGMAIKIAPGCDLGITTCRIKFNNLLNHGGFPFIPNKSPFGGANVWFIGS
jgi:uncharacterized phage protein (TIGR02218 family)